uniref:Alternative protein n=1 Tax=Macrostomum lignano TaxID=282301 RepID=A0A1I8HX93_9PLAT
METLMMLNMMMSTTQTLQQLKMRKANQRKRNEAANLLAAATVLV